MTSSSLATRTKHRLQPDSNRVLLRLFVPGQQDFGSTQSRTNSVVDRILTLSDDVVKETLNDVIATFGDRHDYYVDCIDKYAQHVLHRMGSLQNLSDDRWRLIGTYFMHEVSIEGAALCNPSVVLHPNQSDLPAGTARFVMSVRSVGEGHRSSIGFRTGLIDRKGSVKLDTPKNCLTAGDHSEILFTQRNFRGLLESSSDFGENARSVLSELDEYFSLADLDLQLTRLLHDHETYRNAQETVFNFRSIAERSYAVAFPESSDFSERVLWPRANAEWRGMEDARFVQFLDNENSSVYYATYTAFDGTNISQQLLETRDFASFQVAPISGRAAFGKGLALFPRKIDGGYVALTREDHETNSISFSDHLEYWDESEVLQAPTRPWELVQLGNCGSPIETEAGWLIMTHAVGPMRTYHISAALLDLQDPARVIGSLNEPLISPISTQRDGYVPNVVYSCGSMIHENILMMPFGIADNSIGIATAKVDEVLTRLTDFQP